MNLIEYKQTSYYFSEPGPPTDGLDSQLSVSTRYKELYRPRGSLLHLYILLCLAFYLTKSEFNVDSQIFLVGSFKKFSQLSTYREQYRIYI